MRDTDAGNRKPEGQSQVALARWAPREPAREKEQLEKREVVELGWISAMSS